MLIIGQIWSAPFRESSQAHSSPFIFRINLLDSIISWPTLRRTIAESRVAQEICMVEVTNSVGFILSFDGRIIENFHNGGSDRFHINQVNEVEVEENKKGEMWIKVKAKNRISNLTDIDPSKRGLVEEFVSQVNAALS
ncbi:MAG: hypothetical protein CMN77_19195 [Spirochaetaceae bacterium]|nr:hypothetical protein [Spirochaetaceae bacterium]